MQLKPIAAILVLLLIVTSLLVAGCASSTNNNQAASSASSVATKTANTTIAKTMSIVRASPPPIQSPLPTPIPPTPTPTPTPRPLQCYHVQIIIIHNTSTPCNTCAATIGTVESNPSTNPAHNPYFSMTIQNVNDQNGAGNRMIGIVRETGETTTFAWGDVSAIQAWSIAHLTCYYE